jgi:hypothetical protein
MYNSSHNFDNSQGYTFVKRQKYILQNLKDANKREHKKRTLFHYTPIEKLDSILQCGEIKISSKFIESGLKPVAWFSNNPNHEFAETTSMEGMGRIEIHREPDIFSWEDFKKRSGISEDKAKSMEFIGSSRGAKPSDWYYRSKPLYSNLWVAVEVYKNGHWVLYEKAKVFNKKFFKKVIDIRVFQEEIA